ncbi:unnamed protein product [Bacillus thuringiensis DB27]|uniref:Uncharacterized protein n=1 Tax=Bacillus thuringiensis DB27 TaxID=1431339 RepID=W8YLH0_BACTU|nr:unnamed protein product [Bacillus thuringiensis DB27]
MNFYYDVTVVVAFGVNCTISRITGVPVNIVSAPAGTVIVNEPTPVAPAVYTERFCCKV